MSDKEKDIGLYKITESIKRFERNIKQYKKSIYFETNTQINFIFRKLEEIVNKDIKKYPYHMFEKKRIYVLSDACI
jgi:hypothetical protein